LRVRCHLIALTLATIAITQAAPPRLDAISPPGGQAGTTNLVKSYGGIGAWPVEVWCNNPGIKFAPTKTRYQYALSIGKDVKPGPYLVRIHNYQGVSRTTIFVVGGGKEIEEKEPNGNFAEANSLTNFPIVINGRLEKTGDTDFFKLKLKKGQTIYANVDGYSLGALIDPFIHLYDPDGYDIAVASDTHNIDPFLKHTVDKDGTYSLQVFAIDHKATVDVSFSGRSDAVYRLTVSIDDKRHPGLPFKAKTKEAKEKKDNIQEIKLPATVDGTIAKFNERDRYKFAAKKGDNIFIRVDSHKLHYPLDPVLVVNRPDGRLLRETDDTKPTRDPEYYLKVSQDGDYSVEIFDRFRNGREDFRYRLSVAKPPPAFEVSIDKDVYELNAGKSVDLKLTLKPTFGYKEQLKAILSKLPEGVSLEAGEIKGSDKSATLKLKADAKAKNASIPVQIHLEETGESKRRHAVTKTFITADSRGDYLLNQTDWLWLRVIEAKKEEKKKEEKKDAKK
tara:strand:- start:1855 stop:3369 length:1515 start_codon:yes stop_codon:yes gene_type:complete